jgi:DNA polymerase (family 10)
MSDVSNSEISSLLERYGRLLEIGGESAFRTRAYSRAAESIRHFPGPVAALARSGTLQQIEGVGPGIAGVIEEFVRTGNVADLRTLQKRVPVSLLELIEVPGLGAKSVLRLHAELGITDLTGLETAAQTGKLRTLPGFSTKSEQKILAGIESLRRRSGRYRLGTVLPLGRRLVQELEASLPFTSQVSLAGSVRRMDETVADLDLVIGSTNRGEVIAAVEQLSSVSYQWAQDNDLVSFQLHDGLRLDVVIVPPERFGTALVQTTGNAAHLNMLGPLTDAPSEDAVYAAHNLPLIPPELREGLDELDLARNGQLDSLITAADIRGEFHCHTLWSDGALSVLETAQAAVAHGYHFLGISDHTRSLGVANGLDLDRLRAQRQEIVAAQARLGFRVFASAEVEVARDGHLDFDDPTLSALDIVIASTHVGLRQPREELTIRLLSVLENRNVDIIAHPSGRLIEQREGGDFDWERVIETAARTGTALEINADPARMDLNADLARQAIAAGCLLTINCDAHHPSGWGLLEYGLANARKAGVRPDQVLNTWPLDRIESWLQDRGRLPGE